MSLKFNFDKGAVALPISALEHIAEACESNNIKFLCLLLSHGGAYRQLDEVKEELISLGLISKTDADIACAYLNGAGILTEGKTSSAKTKPAFPTAKASNPPSRSEALQTGSGADSLTSDSIKEWMESNADRQEFVKACEDVYGNVFNKTELMTVITYSQEYRLRDECILAILGYSRENGYGIGYTKKIFNRMVDGNINTLDAVNAELDFLSEHSSYVTVVKQIFGLSRALTTAEKPRVERWHKEYKFTSELIQMAFDRAAQKEKASIAYCDKILIGWRDEGLLTADDVKRKLSSDKSKVSSKIESTYSLSDFFNAAIKRSYEGDSSVDTNDTK